MGFPILVRWHLFIESAPCVFSSVLLPSWPWLKTLSQSTSPNGRHFSGIILRMRPANDRRRYIETSSLIGRAHTQNDHRILPTDRAVQGTVRSLWKIAKNSHRWIMTIADVINKLRPVWCRAIIWTNNVFFFYLIGPLETNLNPNNMIFIPKNP